LWRAAKDRPTTAGKIWADGPGDEAVGEQLKAELKMCASRHKATRRTALIAGAANVLAGPAKLAAGIISGSSAMLAEAAHSAADTLNQGFLLTAVIQADRPADRGHPFGYGQERYFWSLLATFGIFIAGGGFSVFEGTLALKQVGSESPTVACIALAVAFVAEDTSFVRACRQVRGEAGERYRELLGQVETSPDTTVKTALFEDSAAVVGLVFAAIGVVLRQVTGSPVWDGAASMAIGALLVAVAIKLGSRQHGPADRPGRRPRAATGNTSRDREDTRRWRPARTARHAPRPRQPHRRRPRRP